ncbi:MAG: GIY-YIG nuclease family protein [Chitinophagales bacterium]
MALVSKGGYVYIITNANNKVLYTGVTSSLYSRILQHKNKAHPNSFSAKYNINKLVYYAFYDFIDVAIMVEKRIKAGSRKKKIELINAMNPDWNDLFEEMKDEY